MSQVEKDLEDVKIRGDISIPTEELERLVNISVIADKIDLNCIKNSQGQPQLLLANGDTK